MKLSIIVAIVSGLALMSCGQEPTVGGPDSTTPQTPAVSVPAVTDPALLALISKEKSADVQTIGAIKKSGVKAGDTVTIQGRIGGKFNPFVDGYAAMLLADDTVIDACDFNEDDECDLPWDYCCVKKAKRIENMVTVQAVDGDNKVLSGDLKGLDDIKAGSFVVINGTVDAASNGGNVIINISSVFHDRERQIRRNPADGHGHDH